MELRDHSGNSRIKPNQPNVLLEWKSLSVRVGGRKLWSRTEPNYILKNGEPFVISLDMNE